MKTFILCTVDGTKFNIPEAVYEKVQHYILADGAATTRDHIVIEDLDGTVIIMMRSAISYLYDFEDEHVHGEGCSHDHASHGHSHN
jgi:hypothetical protein